MEVIRKNRKEDLKILVYLGEKYGGEKFRITFTAGKYYNIKFRCSFDGEKYKNCEKVDDTHVLCRLDNHGLPIGLLCVELAFFLPDQDMPDGDFKINEKKLVECEDEGVMKHIELTDGMSDCVITPEVTFQLLSTVLRGEKFRYEDFTPEEIEELQAPAIEAASRADNAAKNADNAAKTALEAATEVTNKTNLANQAATNAETAARDANSVKDEILRRVNNGEFNGKDAVVKLEQLTDQQIAAIADIKIYVDDDGCLIITDNK